MGGKLRPCAKTHGCTKHCTCQSQESIIMFLDSKAKQQRLASRFSDTDALAKAALCRHAVQAAHSILRFGLGRHHVITPGSARDVGSGLIAHQNYCVDRVRILQTHAALSRIFDRGSQFILSVRRGHCIRDCPRHRRRRCSRHYRVSRCLFRGTTIQKRIMEVTYPS